MITNSMTVKSFEYIYETPFLKKIGLPMKGGRFTNLGIARF